MTGHRPVVARLARAGYRFGIPGIPLLLLVGLALFLSALVSSNLRGSLADYWFLVAIGWLSSFFAFAIIGVLAGYWLPRIMVVRRGQERYVPEAEDWLPAYAGILPVVGFTALIIDGSGAPVWLYVLGVVSVVVGLAAFVDTLQLGRRSKKRKAGRRG
ncbi:MAG: hypothetical protein JO272_14010 [Pseudonocardiales bacterium]|nr:hypothetical protein [Pseudonocardiales bacterium]